MSAASIRTTTHITAEKQPKVLKEGVLYKQRNHFKGSGTIVVTETNVKHSNDVAYYPFMISHARSSMVYRLSTTSKEERDSWVTALNNLINQTGDDNNSTPYVYTPSGSMDTTTSTTASPVAVESKKEDSDSLEMNDSDDPFAMENPSQTLSHIPPHCVEKVEENILKLLDAASSDDPSQWSLMFNKKGVAGYSKIETSSTSSAAICVKGVCKMPFTIPQIYDIVSNGDRRADLDSQLAEYRRLKWFSRHTGVEHLQFKAVWPTTARDFCNLTHWRLLKSGTLVSMGMSEKFHICPEQSNFVRARLIGGGYVFKPVHGGTLVTIVVQSDLGGTLPASICNLAAQSQPYVLLSLRKLLEKSRSHEPLPMDTLPPKIKYEDILDVAVRYQKIEIESEATRTRDSSHDSIESSSKSLNATRLTQKDFIDSLDASPPSSNKHVVAEDDLEPLYPDIMRAEIPAYCSSKVETLINRILKDATSTNASEWSALSSKKDIKGFAKANAPSGAAFYVKGETFLPYSIPEIFSAYFDPTNRPVLDSQMATYSRLRWMSRHVGYEYMQFKGQWPTTARDSCNLTHWRLLKNGILVDLGFSDKAQPEDSNFVRAELQMGGYVLIPVRGGTRAVIVVDTRLGGSLPNSICQMASAHQPSTLHKLHTLLDKMYKNDNTRASLDTPVPPEKVYDQLLSIAQKLQGNKVECLNPNEKSGDVKPKRNSLKGASTGKSVKAIPPNNRVKASKNIDIMGVTLFLLPLVDLGFEFGYGRSVFYGAISGFSILLTLYLYLMYYEKLVSWILENRLGNACQGSTLRAGAEVYKFHVDLGRIEEYLSELQLESTSESTLTAAHIVVKAVGIALDEMRHVHGVLLTDRLYRAPGAQIDVSVTESSGAGDHAGIFLHVVHDVASPLANISTIAHEVANSQPKQSSNVSALRFVLRIAQPFIPTFFTEHLLVHTNTVFIALLAVCGVNVCPFGAARVVSVLPHDDINSNDNGRSSITSAVNVPGNSGDMDESEVDFSVLPMTSRVTSSRRGLCLPPVTVTLGNGGVKFIPVQHQEKKIVRKFRVLNVSVCLHEVLTSSPGCSLQERQEFSSRLKSLLNRPKQLFP